MVMSSTQSKNGAQNNNQQDQNFAESRNSEQLIMQSTLQMCSPAPEDQHQNKVKQFDALSRELENIPKTGGDTTELESLIYLESQDADVEQFKMMKGLDNLAKLSIEDCELKMYTDNKAKASPVTPS